MLSFILVPPASDTDNLAESGGAADQSEAIVGGAVENSEAANTSPEPNSLKESGTEDDESTADGSESLDVDDRDAEGAHAPSAPSPRENSQERQGQADNLSREENKKTEFKMPKKGAPSFDGAVEKGLPAAAGSKSQTDTESKTDSRSSLAGGNESSGSQVKRNESAPIQKAKESPTDSSDEMMLEEGSATRRPRNDDFNEFDMSNSAESMQQRNLEANNEAKDTGFRAQKQSPTLAALEGARPVLKLVRVPSTESNLRLLSELESTWASESVEDTARQGTPTLPKHERTLDFAQDDTPEQKARGRSANRKRARLGPPTWWWC